MTQPLPLGLIVSAQSMYTGMCAHTHVICEPASLQGSVCTHQGLGQRNSCSHSPGNKQKISKTEQKQKWEPSRGRGAAGGRQRRGLLSPAAPFPGRRTWTGGAAASGPPSPRPQQAQLRGNDRLSSPRLLLIASPSRAWPSLTSSLAPLEILFFFPRKKEKN